MDYQNNDQNQYSDQSPWPSPPPPPPDNSGKGMAVGALVCGIVSVVFCWLFYVAIPASLVAIVLGVLARKKLPQGGAGMATAGLVLGIIGLGLSVLTIACIVCAAGMAGSMINEWGINPDSFGF